MRVRSLRVASSLRQESRGATALRLSLSLAPGRGPGAPYPRWLLPQPFEHFHHRPRIPLAVVEQILPHSGPLFRRNLARHKEEPSDFDARHEPVDAHEIVVSQLRDQRV